MVLSDVSIKRPVFATVISLLLVVVGLAAFMRLSVREYPAIDPPIVSIVTVYKGASNDVVESRITELVESAVAGIEGVKTITSSSREERSQVVIEFRVGRDVDAAAADVRDRIGRIMARLPDTADLPVITKVDSDARAIVWFTLASDKLSQMEMTDYARRYIVDRLSIVPGVASVFISGERRFAMRIWVDRQAISARGLTVEDIETAIKRQNVDLPGGRIESTQRELTVKTDSRLSTPDEFRKIIVATRGGYQIRLGEVAKVEVAPEDNRSEMRANGRGAIGIGVLRQSTANTLSVADGAKAEMEVLRKAMPPEIDVLVGYDESLFIRQSINEVFHALFVGMGLVILVIFLFLRSVRATLIPAVSIPVSIIGSFIVLSALGFSINVLTLLALVLAIGIVVDDAIVVLENVERIMSTEKLPAHAAAVKAMSEVSGPVIAIVLVLDAVFIPVAFMGGLAGEMYKQFAVTIAVSVTISGIVDSP